MKETAKDLQAREELGTLTDVQFSESTPQSDSILQSAALSCLSSRVQKNKATLPWDSVF